MLPSPLLLLSALLASASPLLTYAWLWQLKEWRVDRLREELAREGLYPLVGRARPSIVGIAAIIAFVDPALASPALGTGLLLLALLSGAGFAMGRQRMPRWTPKALCIAALAGTLDMAGGGLVLLWDWPLLLLLLPLAQPLVIGLSWLLFWPVDRWLKGRVLRTARAMRRRFPRLVVVGITGSVGKTTTKELLGHLLQDLHPAVTPAYMNAEIGVARWLIRTLAARAPEDASPLVIEMGAYSKGEIALLSDIARPTVGVVTAVGDQHLALFGSEEAIAQAKGELIASLPPDGRAFLNGDQPLVRSMAERAACPVTLAGTGGRLDVEAFDITETEAGLQFRTQDTLLLLPMRGTHNVVNVLLAVSVAQHLGIRLPRIAELLRSFRPPHQTFSVRAEGTVTVLDDTHNSSSSSIRAAIAWARTQPQERKTLLAAGLIELGEKQAPVERELGGLCKAVFDRVIVLDPASRSHVADGYGEKTELYSTQTPKVEPGSLLVCVGRMSGKTVSRLLP